MDDFNLDNYLVSRAPPSVYYVPNFISDCEEARVWQHIYSAPKPKWKVLSHRRLQNWGGLPHERGMLAEPLPQWLKELTNRLSSIQELETLSPNHVLVNEYKSGEGIMAHVDGPLFYPTICTVNTGCHSLLNLYSYCDKEMPLMSRYIGSLLLEPGSLLILKEEAYTAIMHDISSTSHDLVDAHRVLNWNNTALGKHSNEVWSALERCKSVQTVRLDQQLNPELKIGKNYDNGQVQQIISSVNENMENKATEACDNQSEIEDDPSNIRSTQVDEQLSVHKSRGMCFSPDYSGYEIEFEFLRRSWKRHLPISDSDCSKYYDNEHLRDADFVNIISEKNACHTISDKKLLSNDVPASLFDIFKSLQLVGSGSCVQDTKLLKDDASSEIHHAFSEACPGLSGIQFETSDGPRRCFQLCRGTRVSLTIRRVPKVIKSKIFLPRSRR